MSREQQQAERRARKLQTCAHFNGMQNKACKAGCNIRAAKRDAVGRPAELMPCLPPMSAFQEALPLKECPSFRVLTQAEIDAEEAEWDKVIQRMTVVMPVVAVWRKKLPIGKSEIIECPVCKGRLHLSQSAYNGHVHGRCETDGCAKWME